MTACEVLTWIGLGRPVTWIDLNNGTSDAQDEQRVAEATQTVIEALRAGRLVAYGLPSDADGALNRRVAHVPVPLGVLLHPAATVRLDDQITADGDAWFERRALTFHDVRFQTAAVLALWPVQTPPPVRLDDLPADWTLIEAMAWIMLRDPAVVRDAAPETMREGGTFCAEHRLPDGRKEMIAEAGAPGVGRIRLTLLSVAAKLDNPGAVVVAAGEAEGALLAALRAGKLSAHGKPYGGDMRAMEPRDWRGLILHEQQRGGLIAAPWMEIGQRWWNVTLPRAAVVALWPSYEAKPAAPAPVVAETNAPPRGRLAYSPTLAAAEYKARALRWSTAQAQSGGKLRPPSPEDDRQWAIETFGSMPRAVLRNLRADTNMMSWTKPGKKTGAKWRE
jgi:hypothetical protein